MAEKLLTAVDPDAIGVFRVNGSTTASVNAASEVTIRQVQRQTVPIEDAVERATARHATRIEEREVILKLQADDFTLVGRMVAALLRGDA
jgi:hypothetical protein